MTDETTPPPPEAELTEEEQQAAFRQHMAFNAEAARSGLFAAAMDIADTMNKANVAHGEACLLTGAAEMVAQLWQQVGKGTGKSSREVRQTLVKEINFFFHKSRKADAAPPATKH